MEKELFNDIINKLDENTLMLDSTLKDFNTIEDINNLTFNQLNDIIKFCANNMSIMDKFISADLYHIIGMGNMSSAQSLTFLNKVKNYLSYRSKLKYFACNFNDLLNNMPKTFISDKATHIYNLHLLPTQIVGNNEVKYFKIDNNEIFKMKGYTIKVKQKSLKKFTTILSTALGHTNPEYTYEQTINAINSNDKFCGITWQKYDKKAETYTGVIRKDQRTQLLSYMGTILN